MLNTKFDLYKAEWLDLVFDDRNKAYGAYDLRNHYARNLNKAMAITFAFLLAASLAVYIISNNRPVKPVYKGYIIKIPTILPPKVETPKKGEKPAKAEAPQLKAPKLPSEPVKMSAFPPMKIVPQEVKTDPPINSTLGDNIASKASDGTKGIAAIDPPSSDEGIGTVAAADNTVHNSAGLEVMPEPVGGFAAFGKFLGKNLRFPGAAQDAGVAGRVTLTFVIEKNGDITNINIDNPAGYGFDQEATRVLKLAKAWKPGIQNGQPVRVRYSIPINFQLPAE